MLNPISRAHALQVILHFKTGVFLAGLDGALLENNFSGINTNTLH